MLGIDAAGFALDISAPPLDCFGNLYGKNVNLGTKKLCTDQVAQYILGCPKKLFVEFCNVLWTIAAKW